MAEMDIDWFNGRLMPTQVNNVLAGAIASQIDRQPVFTEFVYPIRGGFHALMKPALAGADVTFQEEAIHVNPSSKIVTFASGRQETYQTLVSTVPLPTLINMMSGVPGNISEATSKLKWTQLICINLVIDRAGAIPWDWFYIYDTDIEASRVSVPSNLSLYEGPETLVQAEVFRRSDEAFDLEEIKVKTVRELCALLGLKPADIRAVEARHVPFGYVVPTLGHASTSSEIIDWLKAKSIETAGLFGRWRYLWSDVAYNSGEETAGRIKTSHPL
jgi:protoporphyrinogen oxidase